MTTSPTATGTTGDDVTNTTIDDYTNRTSDDDGNVTSDGAGKEATIFGETCVTFGNNSALFKYFAKCLVLFVCLYQK